MPVAGQWRNPCTIMVTVEGADEFTVVDNFCTERASELDILIVDNTIATQNLTIRVYGSNDMEHWYQLYIYDATLNIWNHANAADNLVVGAAQDALIWTDYVHKWTRITGQRAEADEVEFEITITQKMTAG